jgi:hypothetical protein
MLLPGTLFAAFLVGSWLYCLTDAALTPGGEFTGWPKRRWIALIAVTFTVGAIAWTVARRRRRASRRPVPAFDHLLLASLGDENLTWYSYPPADGTPEAALARHPASRSRLAGGQVPLGPDDDPEFLRQLTQRIRGEQAE